MDNLHEPSSILSPFDIKRLEKTFEASWSKKTVHPNHMLNWSAKNKALGQCAVTVLLIQDIYGGDLMYDRKNDHFWNMLPDGSQQDFSRTQFQRERVLEGKKIKSREKVLYSKGAKKARTLERYVRLKSEFLKKLSSL